MRRKHQPPKPKSGYVKVNKTVMLDALLDSNVTPQLLASHLTELKRIKSRDFRTNYISKNELNFVTILYQDVILNKVTYAKPQPISLREAKKMSPQHVGMLMLSRLSSATT